MFYSLLCQVATSVDLSLLFFCVHPIPSTRPHKPNAQGSKIVDFSYTQMLHIVNKLPKLLFSPMMLVQFCYGYSVMYISLLLLLFLTRSLLTIHKFVDYTCMLLLLVCLIGKTGCHFSAEQPHLFQKCMLPLLIRRPLQHPVNNSHIYQVFGYFQ